MYTLWTLFFYVVTFSSTNASLQDSETYKVVFVNVIHRHGDRTPTNFYRTDPYQNASFWPEPMGQLTNLGKQQVFKLGQWLRQRYDALLTDQYSADIIYVQSTDKDRTLMSAECVLAGMFPPKGQQKWSDDLAWQPIPVHTTPMLLDKILSQPPRTPCPAYSQEFHKFFSTSDEIKTLNKTYSELLQWTNENSGDYYDLMTLYNVYDNLFIETLYNFSLPAWTAKVFPEPMLQANVYNYMFETWTPKLARLQTGLLVKDMLRHMTDKVQNKTTRNLHFYSAHDETMVNVMNALGAFNFILPPYASCLMLELRQDSNGAHFVSLYLRNSTEAPYLLTVGGCTPVCPLDQFINVTRPIIPEDWDKECAVADGGQPEESSLVYWLIGIASAAVIVLALCGLRRCVGATSR